MNVVAVMCARNEADNIERTLSSLKAQTLPLDIILVNDGSIDNTADIARKVGCSVIVNLPYHEESYIARPELAGVWNAGFERALEFHPEYVLIVGADNVLPETYVERIVERMELNPRIVVASGRIEGELFKKEVPRGGGRVIRVSFWEPYGLKYPEVWGWESWILYKALERGMINIAYHDIVFHGRRVTSTSVFKSFGRGKNMRALGYHWAYVLGEAFVTFKKSPRAGLATLRGWLSKGVVELDVAAFVRETQKRRLRQKLKRVIGR